MQFGQKLPHSWALDIKATDSIGGTQLMGNLWVFEKTLWIARIDRDTLIGLHNLPAIFDVPNATLG
ncbi:hypothetical protein D3C86_2003830 [compost metagenome]